MKSFASRLLLAASACYLARADQMHESENQVIDSVRQKLHNLEEDQHLNEHRSRSAQADGMEDIHDEHHAEGEEEMHDAHHEHAEENVHDV